uniref:uncharacterized protein LOC120329905 n=1 Tax=Styela clava TaxID=7725 RepID=UPI00193A7341|nr:uncharacterized protein LOC120329905 [Styela clava]
MNFSTNNSGTEAGGLVLEGASFAIWVSSVCISFGYFVATSYVMVMLIIDMFKDGVGPSSSNEGVGKNMAKWIKVSRFLFVTICNTLYLSGWFGRILVDFYNPEFCNSHKSLRIMVESAAATFTYLTVWLRHRIIHNIPAMQHSINYATRILSIIVLVLAIVVPPLNRLIVVLTSSSKVTQTGCDIVEMSIPIQMPLFILGASSIVMQVIILGLFLQPLRQHQKNIGRAADNLTPMLKRAFFTTLVCCVSDVAASVLVVVAGLFIADISMETTFFINIWMILICFPEWKTTLFPFISFTSEVN